MSLWTIETNKLYETYEQQGINPERMGVKQNQNIGMTIRLLTPEEFLKYPEGTILYDIFGERMVIGKDRFHLATRGGFLPYGIKVKE